MSGCLRHPDRETLGRGGVRLFGIPAETAPVQFGIDGLRPFVCDANRGGKRARGPWGEGQGAPGAGPMSPVSP